MSRRAVVADELALACDRGSPRQARRFVEGLVVGHAKADEIALLTSELVTNAVCHATTPSELLVQVSEHTVRVEVHDASSAPVQPRLPDHEGGRGLRLVELLSDRWGVDKSHDGKSVWFEIDEPAARATPQND